METRKTYEKVRKRNKSTESSNKQSPWAISVGLEVSLHNEKQQQERDDVESNFWSFISRGRREIGVVLKGNRISSALRCFSPIYIIKKYRQLFSPGPVHKLRVRNEAAAGEKEKRRGYTKEEKNDCECVSRSMYFHSLHPLAAVCSASCRKNYIIFPLHTPLCASTNFRFLFINIFCYFLLSYTATAYFG